MNGASDIDRFYSPTMKRKIRYLGFAAISSCLLSLGAERIVVETFDYPTEPYGLGLMDGGRGFRGPWMTDRKNWSTVEGVIERDATNLDQYRYLNNKLTGVFYARVDLAEQNEPDGAYLNSLAFQDSEGKEGLLVGLEDRSYRLVVGDSKLVRGDYTEGDFDTLVVRFEFNPDGPETVSLWINPAHEIEPPLVADFQAEAGLGAFERISPQTFKQEGGALSQDNIAIGTTFEAVLNVGDSPGSFP